MRYIVIPKNVQVVDPRTKMPAANTSPKTFVEYAYEIWFNDTRISEKGPIKVRRWMKVVEAFDGKEAGDVVPLEDSDWEMLRDIVREPKAFYPPLVAMQFDPFFAAVDEAPIKEPVKAKEVAVDSGN